MQKFVVIVFDLESGKNTNWMFYPLSSYNKTIILLTSVEPQRKRTRVTAKTHWMRLRSAALVSPSVLYFPLARSDFVRLNRADQIRLYLTGSHAEKRHRESGQFSK